MVEAKEIELRGLLDHITIREAEIDQKSTQLEEKEASLIKMKTQ